MSSSDALIAYYSITDIEIHIIADTDNLANIYSYQNSTCIC